MEKTAEQETAKTFQRTRMVVMAAAFAALACVATMVVKVPSPTGGYMNLGDTVVLLGGYLLGPAWGALAGSIGPALALSLIHICACSDLALPSGTLGPSAIPSTAVPWRMVRKLPGCKDAFELLRFSCLALRRSGDFRHQCSTGSSFRAFGFATHCPGGHRSCSLALC